MLGRILVAVALAGAGWYAWDAATTDDVVLSGDRFEQIDAYVVARMADTRIPGVALAVVEGGETVYARGYGTDGRGGTVTAGTPFWIGSLTKSMTALAVMQLAEDGEIDLDAPVRTYLPWFRLADEGAAARITVRHLLEQTSGISRLDGLRAVVDADPDHSIDDVVAGMADLRLNRPVGERFEYANLNSVVLGAVVEAVTGASWQRHVEDRIFGPLAMTRTFVDQDAARAAGLTATHRTVFGFPMRTGADHLAGLAPSGYVYSTAHDMARYLTAFVDGGAVDGQRVLDAEGIDEMLSPATDERSFPLQGHRFSARYGAGWFVGPFGSVDDARWHQGSLPHFSSWMAVLPTTDQAVIVMMNAGNQFELAGANAGWSRIPMGVVDIVVGERPPAATGTARMYIVFTTLAALALVAQTWTLARVVTDRSAGGSRARRGAAFGWELVLAPLVLIAFPALAGGLGWSAAIRFVPDLSITVAVIAGLAVITGLVRVGHLVLARHRERRRGARPRQALAPDPAPGSERPCAIDTPADVATADRAATGTDVAPSDPPIPVSR